MIERSKSCTARAQGKPGVIMILCYFNINTYLVTIQYRVNIITYLVTMKGLRCRGQIIVFVVERKRMSATRTFLKGIEKFHFKPKLLHKFKHKNSFKT